MKPAQFILRIQEEIETLNSEFLSFTKAFIWLIFVRNELLLLNIV